MTQDTETAAHSVRVGLTYGGKRVKRIGSASGHGRNDLVPVQFRDSTYGVVWCSRSASFLVLSNRTEWNELLAGSDAMPTVDHGIGSDVLHIGVTEGGKHVLLKKYYNEKANYNDDSIHRG